MNVDKVAAMQGVGDIAKETDAELCGEIREIMSRISKPGEVRRPEFNLNEFLAELSKVDFDAARAYDVAKILGVLGESLCDGVSVADR